MHIHISKVYYIPLNPILVTQPPSVWAWDPQMIFDTLNPKPYAEVSDGLQQGWLGVELRALQLGHEAGMFCLRPLLKGTNQGESDPCKCVLQKVRS